MPQSQTRPGNSPAPKKSAATTFQFRISSENVPAKQRAAILNRLLEQTTFGTQAEAVNDQPLWGTVVQRTLPGLHLLWTKSAPFRTIRTRPLLADGADSVLFSVASARRESVQFGREYSLAAGEAMVTGNTGPGSVTYPESCGQVSVIVPQKTLGPMLRERSAHFLHRVPTDNGASRLLVGYLNVLKDVAVPAGMEQAIATHIQDLLAVIVGATPDGVEIANARGVRAARRQAIKIDVLGHLDGALSVGVLAAQHRLTPRYVQMLFEDEGTTFTEFVRNHRLDRARGMLTSPRFDHIHIGDIAFDVGFSDLSYFNRAFRRRFGLSPKDVRMRRAS